MERGKSNSKGFHWKSHFTQEARGRTKNEKRDGDKENTRSIRKKKSGKRRKVSRVQNGDEKTKRQPIQT